MLFLSTILESYQCRFIFRESEIIMKNKLSSILAVALIFSLVFAVACDTSDPGTATEPDGMTTTAAEETSEDTIDSTATRTPVETPEDTVDSTATRIPDETAEMTDKDTTPTPEGKLLLSSAVARQMVIKRFGTPSIVQKIEYNYDDYNPLYKGEALKEGYKAVFELSAVTGEFKKWDEDDDDDEWFKFSHVLDLMITMDDAAEIVIKKSGVKDTFVQKIEFDWDEDMPLYKGEAFSRGYKYQFEIEAYEGSFYKWDVDYDDDTWEKQYYNVR